jgi:signal transduction histidine kinase
LKTKTFIALILIVCLPLVLLGWLGLRSAKNEQQLLERRAVNLVNSQLNSIDDSIQEYFTSLQQDLLKISGTLSNQTDEIRSFVWKEGRVRHIFIFNSENERQYPPINGKLTLKEKQFLDRSRWVWSQLGISDQTKATNNASQMAQTDVKIFTDQNLDQPKGNDSNPGGESEGWFTLFTGGEMSHIFWRRDETGVLHGFEMDPSRISADLIGRLPDTGNEEEQENFHIRMIDSQGRTVYQWGVYETPVGDDPLSMLPLTHPMASWKLEYYGPGFEFGEKLQWLNVLAILLIVGAALFGLAFYLYREHTREIALAQQRVNFVSQVSHELRSPLTNIRLYAELLDDRIAGEETESDEKSKSQKYIGVIVSESQRLSRLITNVLNFSRGAKKKLTLRTKPARVDDIIKTNTEAFRPILENKNVKINYDLKASNEVLVDPDALEQILSNVFSNVEKYGSSGKRVDIESRQDNGRTIIKVRDYGPGVPAKDKEKVFQPFYRSSSRLTDGVAGAGIGLSIARELAQLHGGDLMLLDTSRGACFQIELHTSSNILEKS